MIPAAREPARRGRPGRLFADDVDFALRALLGPAGPEARRAVATRLSRRPTLSELVEVACRRRSPRARRLALRLLDAYFHLDPPVPASGDAAS